MGSVIAMEGQGFLDNFYGAHKIADWVLNFPEPAEGFAYLANLFQGISDELFEVDPRRLFGPHCRRLVAPFAARDDWVVSQFEFEGLDAQCRLLPSRLAECRNQAFYVLEFFSLDGGGEKQKLRAMGPCASFALRVAAARRFPCPTAAIA